MKLKEIKDLMPFECSPNAKLLLISISFSGGNDINPYSAGNNAAMTNPEIHQGLIELKNKKLIRPGTQEALVSLKDKK